MNDETRARLADEIRASAPRGPGVYAFIDARGRLMYVGKSVNLRRRMGSYFRVDPRKADSHLGQLAANIGAFAWWRTRSELLALLFEDAMIKECLPPLNTRQREHEENRYLRITEDVFPTCVIVESEDPSAYPDVHGPFKDWRAAGRMRDILHETLGIRTCRGHEPSDKCLDYDLDHCSGPCRGAVDPAAYSRVVGEVAAFLTGDDSTVVPRLAAARDRAASGGRFEEAARLQRALLSCQSFTRHQRFVARFAHGEFVLEVPDDAAVHRFDRGALVEPRTIIVATGGTRRDPRATPPPFDPERRSRRAIASLRATPSDPRFLADRARIVAG